MILLYFKWITINVEYINRITNVCQWHQQLNAENKYFGQTMPLNDITHQAMQTSSYCFHVLRLWSNIDLPFQRICTSYSQIMDMWNKSNRLEKCSIWWMLWQTTLQRKSCSSSSLLREEEGGLAIRFHSIGPNGKKASFIAYTWFLTLRGVGHESLLVKKENVDLLLSKLFTVLTVVVFFFF